MTTLAPEAADRLFSHLFTTLTDAKAPRLWSFVVTIFGDLAQRDDARISGALLGTLVGRIGAKPEALRVALHRLRKEGWIESHKTGRASAHGLTAWGRQQAAMASTVIYGSAPSEQQAWLILHDPADRARQPNPADHPLTNTASISLAQPTAPHAEAALSLPLTPSVGVPTWVQNQMCTDELLHACQDLEYRLTQVAAAKALLGQIPALERMVLRVLVVHSWRRVILKAPALPVYLLPWRWRGEACAALVRELLGEMPPMSLEHLAAETRTKSAVQHA